MMALERRETSLRILLPGHHDAGSIPCPPLPDIPIYLSPRAVLKGPPTSESYEGCFFS